MASVGRKGDGPKALGANLSQLKAHLDHCQKNHSEQKERSTMLQAPPTQQLATLVQGGFVEAVVTVLEAALVIARTVTGGEEKEEDEKKNGKRKDTEVVQDAALITKLATLLPESKTLDEKLKGWSLTI